MTVTLEAGVPSSRSGKEKAAGNCRDSSPKPPYLLAILYPRFCSLLLTEL